MKVGKVGTEVLNRYVFSTLKNVRTEVLLQPSIGEDCSAVQLAPDEVMVLSSDPITGAQNEMGYIAVHINANDLASSGAEPIGIFLTILLPPNEKEKLLYEIMQDVGRACEEIGAQVLGGHTEVTDSVVKPILSVTAVGKVKKNELISSGGSKPGEDVVMTKWAGLEGTSIIAIDGEPFVKEFLSEEEIHAAKSFTKKLSVLPESRVARHFSVSAMHDVTEGGILGAIWEMAECSHVGVEIQEKNILVHPITQKICKKFDLNPFGLISSGCMLLTTPKGKELIYRLKELGIEAAIIGKTTTELTKNWIRNNEKVEITLPQVDELYKVELP